MPEHNTARELKLLSEQVRKAGLDRHETLTLVPMIIRHLRTLDIHRDRDDPQLYTPTRAIIFQCFVGLQSVMMFADQDTLLRIMKYWSNIWDWCTFLIATVVVREACTEAECNFQEDVHEMIASVALYLPASLQRSPESLRSIFKTPLFFATITGLWIRSLRNNDGALLRTSDSMSLLQTLTFPDEGLRSFLADTPDAVMLCTNRVMQSVRKRTTEMELISGPILFLRHCLSYYSATHSHLFASPAVSAMALVMARLTSPHFRIARSSSTLSIAVKIIPSCLLTCSVFLNFSMHLCGCTRVVEALDGQVLISLLRTLAFLVSNSKEYPNDLLLNHVQLIKHFTCYTLYPSVLRKVARSLNRIDSLGLEQYVPTTGPLHDAWKTLRSTIAQRIDRKNQFLATKHHLCCNIQVRGFLFSLGIHPLHLATYLSISLQCPNPIIPAKQAKRCGDCILYHFCSKRCFRSSWRDGDHRARCRLAISQRTGALDYTPCYHFQMFMPCFY